MLINDPYLYIKIVRKDLDQIQKSKKSKMMFRCFKIFDMTLHSEVRTYEGSAVHVTYNLPNRECILYSDHSFGWPFKLYYKIPIIKKLQQ